MIKQILLVGLGGGIGSILRFLASMLALRYYSNSFPLATLTVNVVGCFFIGILFGLLGQNNQINQSLKLLFITGFCGGYTTFSAFAYENFSLLQSNSYWTAAIYIIVSIFIGLFAVWLGMSIGMQI